MKELDNLDTVAVFFQLLQAQLAGIYEDREATNIASIIFEDAFGLTTPTQSTQVLSTEQQAILSNITTELLQHRPWQYVLGEADFYGLKFKTNEAVLIPRQETEELVQEIINQHSKQPIQLLDIGTGSGCIAITLQKYLKNAQVTAVDISEKALQVAQSNAKYLQVPVQFQQLDILDDLACKKMPLYHVIVSNPPYIQDTERYLMPKQVLDFEPHMALFVTDKDPLQFYKKIADFALEHLHPHGCLYVEINEFFGNEVLQMFQEKGFQNCQLIQDISGKNRIAIGRI